MKPTVVAYILGVYFALKMTDPMRFQSASPGSKRQISFRVKNNFQDMKEKNKPKPRNNNHEQIFLHELWWKQFIVLIWCIFLFVWELSKPP